MTFLTSFAASVPTNGARLSVLAVELPRAITPTIAGLTVGAFVGVVGFIAVLLLVGRGKGRVVRRHAAPPHQLVTIPPYAPLPRETPLPPQAFTMPMRETLPSAYVAPSQRWQAAPVAPAPRAMPFVPSTALSARAFAKMGYAVPEEMRDEEMHVAADAPDVDPQISVVLDELDESELSGARAVPAAPSRYGFEPILPSVSVAPVVVLSAPVEAAEDETSAPHPLGIIKSSSSAMRAALAASPSLPSPALPPAKGASIGDLAFDDSPTEIGEPFFDEPPQPRRRSDPPKIRAIAPAPPRYPLASQALPQVTPPPSRVAGARN